MANLIRAKAVAAKRGRSVGQLYKDIKDGKFPAGVRLSTKVVVWKESDVDRLVNTEFEAAAEKALQEVDSNSHQAA